MRSVQRPVVPVGLAVVLGSMATPRRPAGILVAVPRPGDRLKVMNRHVLATAMAVGISIALARASTQAPAAPVHAPAYVPHRVYDSAGATFTDFETLVARASRSDITLVGEQHDDPSTHRLELALLEGLARRGASVTVSLEMIERDVQALLDAYLADRLAETEFLKGSRPWPRYQTDYRPLVEFARAKLWPIVAANVPRRLASEVGRRGLAALDALSGADRGLAASELQCLRDSYYERFVREMSKHPAPAGSGDSAVPATGASTDATLDAAEHTILDRFYEGQCLKDETMAESVERARRQTRGATAPVVVHFTGAFHIEYGHGMAARVRRRAPGATLLTVSFVPLERLAQGDPLDTVDPARYRDRADFVVFTLKPVHP